MSKEIRKHKLNFKQKRIKLLVIVLLAVVYFGSMFAVRRKNDKNYNLAEQYLADGQYEQAGQIYKELGPYAGAKEKADAITVYMDALELMQKGEYDEAIKKWESISEFGDSAKMIQKANYKCGEEYLEKGNYKEARKYFVQANGYEKSNAYLLQIAIKEEGSDKKKVFDEAVTFYNIGNYEEALERFKIIPDYEESHKYIEKCQQFLEITYDTAVSLYKQKEYGEALKNFDKMLDYKESRDYAERCRRYLNGHLIAAGVKNSVAITEQGNIKVAGTNKQGQKDVQDFKNIVSVDTYGCFVAGLTEKGKVVYSGQGVKNEQPEVSEWKNIVDITCGENYVIALDKDGYVYGSGHNGSGQLDVKGWEDIIDIDAGWSFTAGLTKDGKLKFAGTYRGQKAQFEKNKDEWKDVVSISAGGGGSDSRQRGKGHTVGLRKDGTVVAVGDDTHNQCSGVYKWKDIIKVVAGDWYTVGLKKNGTIVITGKNFLRSYYIDEKVIKECNKNKDIVDIAAGFGETLCLKTDGTVVSFGFDSDGVLNETKDWKGLKVDF